MQRFQVSGYSPYAGTWFFLGVIEAKTQRGANQKAHNKFNRHNDYDEFALFPIKEA